MVLLLALAGCVSSQPALADHQTDEAGQQLKEAQDAIKPVIDQFNTAFLEFYDSAAALNKHPFLAGISGDMGPVCQRFGDELSAIDISKCPEDFRVTFVNYYSAVYSLKSYSDANSGLRGALKGVSALFTLSPQVLTSIPENSDKAISPLEQATKDLVQVCAKYNLVSNDSNVTTN